MTLKLNPIKFTAWCKLVRSAPSPE